MKRGIKIFLRNEAISFTHSLTLKTRMASGYWSVVKIDLHYLDWNLHVLDDEGAVIGQNCHSTQHVNVATVIGLIACFPIRIHWKGQCYK